MLWLQDKDKLGARLSSWWCVYSNCMHVIDVLHLVSFSLPYLWTMLGKMPNQKHVHIICVFDKLIYNISNVHYLKIHLRKAYKNSNKLSSSGPQRSISLYGPCHSLCSMSENCKWELRGARCSGWPESRLWGLWDSQAPAATCLLSPLVSQVATIAGCKLHGPGFRASCAQ